MTDHYQPKYSIIMQHLNFIPSLVRKISYNIYCRVDATLGALWVWWISETDAEGLNGMCNQWPWIQHHLLAEHELTYQLAFELAHSIQTADQYTNDLQAAPQSELWNRQWFSLHTTSMESIMFCLMSFARTSKKGHLAKVFRIAPASYRLKVLRNQQQLQQIKRTFRPQRFTIWIRHRWRWIHIHCDIKQPLGSFTYP